MADHPRVIPNLFIVGAAKAGTTTLADLLAGHPEVALGRWKEPNFFALAGENVRAMRGPDRPEVLFRLLYNVSATSWDEYLALFEGAAGHRWVCDASVRNLYYPEAAERMVRAVPEARILIMLRDPVERMHSHYCMMRAVYHLEPARTLDRALELEPSRKAAGWGYDWHYSSVSLYAEQVARYLRIFPRHAVHVVFFEEFIRNRAEVLDRVCAFLDLDPGRLPVEMKHSFPGVWHRWFWFDRWVRRPQRAGSLIHRVMGRRVMAKLESWNARWNQTKPPRIKPEDKRRWDQRFEADKDALARLLGRTLPW